jgi:hypothetical protein
MTRLTLLLIFAPALLPGDWIVMQNGDKLSGHVEDPYAPIVTILTAYGRVKVPRTMILTYEMSEKMDSQLAKDQSILSHVNVVGLADSKGAKALLLNAGGTNCRDSVLLDGEDAGAWSRPAGAGANVFQVKIAEKAPANVKNCWCADGGKWQAGDAGLAILAPGKAVAYLPNIQRRAGFRLCLDPKEEVFVNVAPRRPVDVKVWVNKDGNLPSMARDDIANADWAFGREGAGITLHPVYSKLDVNDFKAKLSSCFAEGPADSHADCCRQVQQSELFEPGFLNVYYGFARGNFTCDKSPTVPASFIHDVPILGDAAHEIGHALGLSQRDTDPNIFYSEGHTSPLASVQAEANFSCGNVMWEGTHYLKNELSTGQAFWMSQSCSSFAARNSACLVCSEAPGAASPCPRFSEGHPAAVQDSPCVKNTVLSKRVFVPRHREASQSCDLPVTTYRDGKVLEADLAARYLELNKHVGGREDLRLGSPGKSNFLGLWEPQFALNLDATSGNAKLALPHFIGSASLQLQRLVDGAFKKDEIPAPNCAAPQQPNR